MTPDASSDLVSRAERLLDAVGSLRAEVDRSASPSRLAMRVLGANPMGGVTEVYQDEAFRIWNEALRRSGDDIDVLHHLAIMHHARAFDLEERGEHKAASSDWKAAHSLWFRLWKADAFWTRIGALILPAAVTEPRRDAIVQALRAELPKILLRVHFAMALDDPPASSDPRVKRAREHLKIARESPLAEGAIEAVRAETYQRVSERRIPSGIWQNDLRDPAVIKKDGTDFIERYLAIDPGCPPALRDALRLEVRLIEAWYTSLRSLEDDSPERKPLLETMAEAGRAWKPYFDQLVPAASTLEALDRQKVEIWYRVMGQVHGALDRQEAAMAFFERGMEATRGMEGEDAGARCRRGYVVALGHVAIEKAQEKAPDALAFAQRAAARKDLTPGAMFFVVQALAFLEQFDEALRLCDEMEKRVRKADLGDEEAEGEANAIRSKVDPLKKTIRKAREHHEVDRALTEAQGLMKNDRWAAALGVTDRVARDYPDHPMVAFYRVQCHMGLDDTAAAERELARFRRLADGAEAHQAADRLGEQLRAMTSRTREFGGSREALALQQEAAAAFNAGNVTRAIDRLREARKLAPGSSQLRKELALCLLRGAVESVNAMGGRMGFGEKSVFLAALTQLMEAKKLDPDNDQIDQNLAILTQILSRDS